MLAAVLATPILAGAGAAATVVGPLAGLLQGGAAPPGLEATLRAGSAPLLFTISLRQHPTLCLDLLRDDDSNGGLLQLWECNGRPNQVWRFDDNSWRIALAHNPKKCIDAGSTMKAGNTLMIWDCNGLPQQTWGYDPKMGTIYLAKSLEANAALCMDSYTNPRMGNGLQVWGCNSLDQQMFNLLVGVTIRLNQNYKACMDINMGKGQLQLWDCNGLANQQWLFDTGTGQIKSGTNLGKCIDMGASAKAGNVLVIWDCNGLPQQKWGWNGDGSIFSMGFQDMDATWCIDSSGGSWNPGTAVEVWNCNGCWNQKWTVAAVTWGSAAQPNVSYSSSSPAVERTIQETSSLGCPNVPSPAPPPPPGPAPAPPAPPCSATAGWPKFDSMQQLQADAGWSKYFQLVYGEVPQGGYPICISDFFMIYPNQLSQAGAQPPQPAQRCPSDSKTPGQYFQVNQGEGLQPTNSYWILHPTPLPALPDNYWLEVIHKSYPSDEHYGAWFFNAKGSGMWFNIGKTIVFQDHDEAYRHFGVFASSSGLGGALGAGPQNEEMSKKCAAQGYDSIQFLGVHNAGTCGTCCQRLGADTFNYEVVACSLQGIYACAEAQDSGRIRAGWMGSRPCHCQENARNGYINCQGVPTFQWSENRSIYLSV